MNPPATSEFIARAAEVIASADALLIGAGAGMGVDSGLPDFRGDQGFWRAYPVYEKLGLDFASMANPRWFHADPALAWGFYGHRLELYRATTPHAGFAALAGLARVRPQGSFVFTSNVDGQFQRAGFDPDRVVEVHGAIDWMQCTTRCGAGIFSADPYHVDVEPETFRARAPLPACPCCSALARPNILMFGDGDWDSSRTERQEGRFARFLDGLRGRSLAIVECGAGSAIPTVRRACERAARAFGGTLIRLNLREAEVPAGAIGVALGARDAIVAIVEAVTRLGA
jgi:NAD-dependent SIR2 family protein deacetylase